VQAELLRQQRPFQDDDMERDEKEDHRGEDFVELVLQKRPGFVHGTALAARVKLTRGVVDSRHPS
jgi:hypothetical protein